MLPILQIGPVSLPLPGLIILAGIWIGLSVAEKYAAINHIKSTDITNLIFTCLISFLVGGRLGYVIRNWDAFSQDLAGIISRNLELFDLLTGILCALLAFIIVCQRKELPVWQTLDSLTPFFALISLSIAFSHLASGNAFGSPTTLPWAIDLWGMPRHPTQIYGILLSIGILILIWPGKGFLWDSQPGVPFLRFLALTAIGVIIIEAFRGDSVLILLGLRRDQVIAWLILAASLAGLWTLSSKREKGT